MISEERLEERWNAQIELLFTGGNPRDAWSLFSSREPWESKQDHYRRYHRLWARRARQRQREKYGKILY